jgi:hypothetical protein
MRLPFALAIQSRTKRSGLLGCLEAIGVVANYKEHNEQKSVSPGPGANARLLLGPRTSSVWLSSSPSSDRRYSEATRQRFVSNTGRKQKVRFTAHTFRSSNEHSKSSETDMTAAKFCRGRCCSAGQPEK